jgi:hypothetical protein
MAIEGKVAAILNERDLIINRGSDADVKEGMKFKVTGEEKPITDPDTGEILGNLPLEKIRVKIVEVQTKYSVGKTYQTYVVNIGGNGPDFSSLLRSLSPRHEVTRVRTLRYDDSIALAPLDEASSFVKVGDPVIQVEDEP